MKIKSIDLQAKDYFRVVTNETFTSARIFITRDDGVVDLLYVPFQECHYQKSFFDKVIALLKVNYSIYSYPRNCSLTSYCLSLGIKLTSSIEWICREDVTRSWGSPSVIESE